MTAQDPSSHLCGMSLAWKFLPKDDSILPESFEKALVSNWKETICAKSSETTLSSVYSASLGLHTRRQEEKKPPPALLQIKLTRPSMVGLSTNITIIIITVQANIDGFVLQICVI